MPGPIFGQPTESGQDRGPSWPAPTPPQPGSLFVPRSSTPATPQPGVSSVPWPGPCADDELALTLPEWDLLPPAEFLDRHSRRR